MNSELLYTLNHTFPIHKLEIRSQKGKILFKQKRHLPRIANTTAFRNFTVIY